MPSRAAKGTTRRRILEFLREWFADEQRRYAPTVRQIGEAVGLSSSGTVHHYLQELKREGVVTWEPRAPRTLQLCEPKGDRS